MKTLLAAALLAAFIAPAFATKECGIILDPEEKSMRSLAALLGQGGPGNAPLEVQGTLYDLKVFLSGLNSRHPFIRNPERVIRVKKIVKEYSTGNFVVSGGVGHYSKDVLKITRSYDRNSTDRVLIKKIAELPEALIRQTVVLVEQPGMAFPAVIAVGGINEGGQLSDGIYLIDPIFGKVTSIGRLSRGRSSPNVFVHGKTLLIGSDTEYEVFPLPTLR